MVPTTLYHLFVLAQAVPPAPDVAATVNELILIAKTFGLGVAALTAWLYFLLRALAANQKEIQTLHAAALAQVQAHSASLQTLQNAHKNEVTKMLANHALELSKFLQEHTENAKDTERVLDSLHPAIQASGDKVMTTVSQTVDQLKLHMNTQFSSLQQVVDKIKNA